MCSSTQRRQTSVLRFSRFRTRPVSEGTVTPMEFKYRNRPSKPAPSAASSVWTTPSKSVNLTRFSDAIAVHAGREYDVARGVHRFDDAQIARILNKQGRRSGLGNPFT